ncbi:MAG: hypothetical protein QOI41_7454, partial [Myxococcales bacterium]|nr:hypothetical protein [Myxococcales bacterium]
SAVAVSVAVGGVGVVSGAVYLPVASTLPGLPAATVHETPFSVDPVTAAVKIGAVHVSTFAVAGETVSVTGPGAGESTGASDPASIAGAGAGADPDELSQPAMAAEPVVMPMRSSKAPAHRDLDPCAIPLRMNKLPFLW